LRLLLAASLIGLSTPSFAQSVFTGFYGQAGIGYENSSPSYSGGTLYGITPGPLYSYGISGSVHPLNNITYYQENKEHIRWYEANKDEDIFKINASAYLYTLINYARSKPDATFMILYMDTLYHPIDVPILDNFLISNISLRRLSNNELASGISYNYFVKKVIADPRYNHLTIPNISILADLIHKAILTKDTSIITYDKFLRGILDRSILSQKDYLYFVNRGFLYNTERYMDRLI
jgi:hypothetical protein